MEKFSPTSTAPSEQDAAALVNETIKREIEKGATNGEALAREIEKNTKFLSDATRQKIGKFTKGLMDATKDGDIKKLEEGTGGQVENGKKTIAVSTLQVRGSIQETINMMNEVGDHENYHKKNKHTTVPLKTLPGRNGGVLLGKKMLDRTKVIEAITVDETGDEFVSDDYKQHKKDLKSAASSAGITMEAVKEAVNDKHDLTLIDDEMRGQKRDAEVEYAMAN